MRYVKTPYMLHTRPVCIVQGGPPYMSWRPSLHFIQGVYAWKSSAPDRWCPKGSQMLPVFSKRLLNLYKLT